VDFYCPALSLAIEEDGVTHSSEDEKQYDSDRQSMIETLNIVFLRFTNDEVFRNIEKVTSEIKRKVEDLANVCNDLPGSADAEPPLQRRG
jgi:very-short-patch-repair endonuclease